jgi:hypothetical protein
MARTTVFRAAAFAVLAAAALMPVAATAEPSASANDTARFIAGLQPSDGSPLKTYTNDAYWKQYAQSFDQAWSGLERRQLDKIRPVVARDFTNPSATLLYFFSGPDFLYANAFFPSAQTYVMAGLEPPGDIPDLRKLTRGQIAGSLRDLRSSLSSVLSYSFFQTKFMRVDFSRAKLNGTLPVLMTFLARSGMMIYTVDLVDLQSDGSLHPVDEQIANPTGRGVKITFGDGALGKKRTLYYFSTDLSDGGIKNSGFLTFCDSLGRADGLIKSASYLMHSDHFSTVRDYLLAHTQTLVQDDSGIPVRYFAHGWQLHPYGRYAGPINLFAGQYQSRMNEVFAKGKTTPVDFSFGYRWRPSESNIMRAVKDDSVTAFNVSANDKAEARADSSSPPKAKPRRYRRQREQAAGGPFSLFGYGP